MQAMPGRVTLGLDTGMWCLQMMGGGVLQWWFIQCMSVSSPTMRRSIRRLVVDDRFVLNCEVLVSMSSGRPVNK
eukprot:1998771-Pyramimonas_sp.AAC.2